MIKKSIPLTLAEAIDLAGDSEKEQKFRGFAKQFVKLSVKEAKEMREELKKLDLIKLKEEYIVKIIDFMPQDFADLTKVLPGVSLNQDESDKILGILKKY
jgi:DNA-directed RNA polymerase subunit F